MIGRWKIYILIIPAFVFILTFFVIPLSITVGRSFYDKDEGITAVNYLDFFRERVSRNAFIRSLKIGGIVTLISIVLSYPTAMAINGMKAGRKTIVMTLIVLPLMTNPVARTFAWLAVIGREGMINNLLVSIGMRRVKILYTEPAVLLGLLQLFMPLMILSLVSSFENLNEDYILAARSLGASRLQTFFKVQLPLTSEGLVVGGMLVFAGSISAYVTPALLGGSRILMLSTLLYQRASVLLDWNMATTIAVIMLTLTILINILLRYVGNLGRSK